MCGLFEDRRFPTWLLLGASLVVLWRIVAYVVADDGPQGWLRLALGGMGLVFVACGLLAYRPSRRWSSIFTLYTLCAGLHWGGPIGRSDLSTNLLFVGPYIVVSSLLAEALFLHFTLELPAVHRASWRRWAAGALYAPSAIGALQVPVIALFDESGPGNLATKALVACYAVATTFAYLAVVVLMLSVWLSRAKASAAWVLMGAIAGGLPSLLYGAGVPLPGPADAYNLFFVLIPLSAVVGLGRRP